MSEFLAESQEKWEDSRGQWGGVPVAATGGRKSSSIIFQHSFSTSVTGCVRKRGNAGSSARDYVDKMIK